MNREEQEKAMDMQFDHGLRAWKTDLYDSAQDARSEARYDDHRRGEPDTREVAESWMSEPHYGCIIDESAGFRDG